jgi:hypothetical protein
MKTQVFTCRYDQPWSVPGLAGLDSDDTLVLAFGPEACAERPGGLRALAEAFPRAKLAGCSTAGEILGRAISDDSLVVAVCRFEGTRLRSAGAPLGSVADSAAAGREIAATLAASDLRAVLVLSDGITVNGSDLLRGLGGALPPWVTVTGGLAGDGSRFQRTWTLRRGVPEAGWVSAVGFYGQHLRVGHGAHGGWETFGPERRVTRAQGNVVHEIDGEPALELYRRYLGELAAELPGSALLFPLHVRTLPGGDPVVRTMLTIDEASRAMTFAGDVPQGSVVQLMRGSCERLVEGARQAALRVASRAAAGSAGLTIAISCVGRRLVMRERAEEEVEAVRALLPAPSELIGFYSYGEISPAGDGGGALHNQTMTLTRLSEP